VWTPKTTNLVNLNPKRNAIEGNHGRNLPPCCTNPSKN
ncbi:hypothetical protein L195_g032654, partial [Trifolium pratense]